MHFKYLRVPFFLKYQMYPFLWCMYGCGPLLLGTQLPISGDPPTHTSWVLLKVSPWGAGTEHHRQQQR